MGRRHLAVVLDYEFDLAAIAPITHVPEALPQRKNIGILAGVGE